MSYQQLCINRATLPEAWLQAFRALLEPRVQAIVPLSVTVTIGESADDEAESNSRFERTLNEGLAARECPSIETTANTLFPQSLWNIEASRFQLYERYAHILPELKRLARANQYGTYFERLVSFQTREGRRRNQKPVNQLEYIITTFRRGNRRRSALQAAVFNPLDDHTHQRQRGFPCLQHVFFIPDKNELAITGVYATQWIFARGYGNAVGLLRLGKFMAHELGLQLVRLTMVASHATLGRIGKIEGRELARNLEENLQ